VLDMARWHFALQGEDILTAASKQALFEPHIPETPNGDSHYGYGWAVFDSPHGKLIAHNGGNEVFSADFRHYVERDLMFFVTCNVSCTSRAFDIDLISERIARVVLDGDLKPAPSTIDLTPERAQQLTGRYTLSDGSSLAVTAKEGSLALAPEGAAAFSAIFPSADAEQARAAADFVKRMIKNSAQGDHSLFQQALGWVIGPEEARQMAQEYWRELRDNYGKLEGVEVVGTLPAHAGGVPVFVRTNLESGAVFGRYDVQGHTLKDMNAFMETLPGATYRATEEGRFVTFDFDTGAIQTFTVETGAESAMTLHFPRAGGEIVARRAQVAW
jgi:hypothetical protein